MPVPFGVAFPTSLTQIGLAIETTRGTPAAPKFWVPVKAPKYDPKLTIIPDETLQGSMVKVYDDVRGMRYDSHGWDGFPYLDTFPVFVRAQFGSSDTLVTAPASTTLAAAAAAGATTISSTATIAVGSWFTIGSAGSLETHECVSVSGAGPYTVTLDFPIIEAQPSGATITGLTGHKFSLLNTGTGQPPSVTITDYDGEEWRQLAACQLDELTIKGNGTGLDDYTCTWFGNPAITPTTPTPSFSGVQTPAPWTISVSIGGTQVTNIEDWEFDFKRNVKPIPALTGTQEYYTYFADAIEATAKFTFVEQSGSPFLAAFLAGVRNAFEFTLFDLESGYALNLQASKGQYITGSVDRSKEWVSVPVELQLLPNATDALAGGVSPCQVTVANGQTTAF